MKQVSFEFAGTQSQPALTTVLLQPDFVSTGLGPAYRSLMTPGQADDLVYEFASYSIDAPRHPAQHWVEVCLPRILMRSLRVGLSREIDIRRKNSASDVMRSTARISGVEFA